MQHILNFYRYNSAVRKKYLDAIEKLPWQEIVKDRGASFHSIRDVFLHVLDAYRYWFEYGIKDNLKGYHRIDRASFKGVDDMRRYEHQVDSAVMTLVEGLREEDLSRVYVIHYHDEAPHVRERTMETILIHMIEEELQHRGEINCMLWQQDVDPLVTGYHEWLDERAAQN